MNEKLRVIGGLTRHDILNKLQIINSNVFLEKRMANICRLWRQLRILLSK